MPRQSLRPILLTFCLVLGPLSGAQKFVPKQIIFSGASAAQSELLTVAGLKPGNSVTQADIQAAAQKLMDTGAFSDIRFAFDGVQLTYTLKSAAMQPVSYQNFPWWDGDSLSAAIGAKVPLF